MNSTIIKADMFPPFSIGRECVFIFHEQQNHGWHLPATFNSQAVRSCSHFICDTIKADLFPPFPIIRKCVFIFHEEHNHGWHVPAFDSQRVRIDISWAGLDHHSLHVPAIFDYQEVRSYITWAAPWPWLTCSCYFWLSAGAYPHFLSRTIMAYMFLPFLMNRKCVFIFYEQHHDHGWHVPAIFDWQRVRIYFHEQQNHSWHIPATFNSQAVRNYWFTIPISFAIPSKLTCSRHFRLLESAYLRFMSSTIMADNLWLTASTYSHFLKPDHHDDLNNLPFLITRKFVFKFHEQHNHDWCVPATFDSQWVRNPIPWTAPWSCLTCSRHFRILLGSAYLYFIMSSGIMTDLFPIIRKCVFIFHKQHIHDWYIPATLSVCVFTSIELDHNDLHYLPILIIRKFVFKFHEQHNHSYVFLPLLTLSGYVIPFREVHHNHDSHVPAILDY